MSAMSGNSTTGEGSSDELTTEITTINTDPIVDIERDLGPMFAQLGIQVATLAPPKPLDMNSPSYYDDFDNLPDAVKLGYKKVDTDNARISYGEEIDENVALYEHIKGYTSIFINSTTSGSLIEKSTNKEIIAHLEKMTARYVFDAISLDTFDDEPRLEGVIGRREMIRDDLVRRCNNSLNAVEAEIEHWDTYDVIKADLDKEGFYWGDDEDDYNMAIPDKVAAVKKRLESKTKHDS